MAMQNVFERSDIGVVAKIFLAAIAASILGKQSRVRLKGDPLDMNYIQAALEATRELRAVLHDESRTVEDIDQVLRRKQDAVFAFEAHFNLPWPV
jgi:hypothetical protein